MKKGLIIFAVVLIIALYVLNKVNTARQLEFTVGLPKEWKLEGSTVLFKLPMTALNVASGSIRIKAVDFNVLSAGKFLGKAIIPNPVTITPNGNTTLLVNVSLSWFDLITASGNILTALKGGKVGLTIDGIVYAEGFQFPTRQTFDLEIPKF